MKRGKIPPEPLTDLQRDYRQMIKQAANDEARRPLVNAFAEQHGDYEQVGKYGEARKAMVNRGGTPIARWKTKGLLSETQQAAIAHCIGLWEQAGTSARLTANLDRTVFGTPGDGSMRQIEALSDLKRIKGYFPLPYWDCFENVARFDEPAGVAGSRLERPTHSRELAARLCVCFVADVIAMKERLSY